jgi:hypothetical protein
VNEEEETVQTSPQCRKKTITVGLSLAAGVLKEGHSRETVDLILPVRDITY